MYYLPVRHVTPSTRIIRERLLPIPGQVTTRQGDRVSPLDVVARASPPGRLHILDMAKALSVKGEIGPYMLKKDGESVRRGEPLAQRRGALGLGRRILRSSVEGTVLLSRQGQVILEEVMPPLELRAYLKGTVTQVMPPYGVVIEASGALIQGLWGLGGEAFGVIRVVVEGPEDPLTAEVIDVNCRGAIVVGGSSMDESALRQAIERQVAGIVVGSFHASLERLFPQVSFPILLTEGLGEAPMMPAIFDILRSHAGYEASISGLMSRQGERTQPEVVIYTIQTAEMAVDRPPVSPNLQVGSRVRLLRAPYRGAVGQVVGLPGPARGLAAGGKLRLVEVEIGGGVRTLVPPANLELISS